MIRKGISMTERTPDAYSAEQITALEGLEAVRMRPGMYIGGVDSTALHHLVFEIVDNSIDEALGGFCTEIQVILHTDSSVTIQDNGRGIPVEIHKDAVSSGTQVVIVDDLIATGGFPLPAWSLCWPAGIAQARPG